MKMVKTLIEQLSDKLDSVFRFALFLTLGSMIIVITAQVIYPATSWFGPVLLERLWPSRKVRILP